MGTFGKWVGRLVSYSAASSLIFGSASCADDASEDSQAPVVRQLEQNLSVRPLDANTFKISVDVPDGTTAEQLALEAKGRLEIGPKARIVSASGSGAQVANLGATRSEVKGRVGSTTSVASVTVWPGGAAQGDVQSAGDVVVHPQGTVSGGVVASTPFSVNNEVLKKINVPGAGVGSVFVRRGSSQTIAPESYGEVRVQRDGVLKFSSGTYYIGRLLLEASSQLQVDASSGPVQIYVTTELLLDGKVGGATTADDTLVAYLGTQDVRVSSSFAATLLAPGAAVSVSAPAAKGGGVETHYGAFFARDVIIAAGATLVHVPFAWDLLRDDPEVWLVKSLESERLIARRFPDGTSEIGSADPPNPIPFEVPARLEVLAGTAGTTRALLTFHVGGTQIQCDYLGGSEEMPAQTALDRARGAFYNLVSCGGGLSAGSHVTASDFTLEILDSHPDTRIAVRLGIGAGCGGSMGYPIDPITSIQMRDAFSWDATTPLPEADKHGRMNLYYVNIYVQNRTQMALLDEMLLQYSGKPMLRNELSAAFGDRCGTINYSGDGEGFFYFAIMPAAAYNFVRNAMLDPAREDDGSELRAVIVRELPEVLRNEDGAFSIDALKKIGFRYLPNARRDESLQVQPWGLGDIVRAGSDFFDDLGESAGGLIGGIDAALSGTVQVTVEMHALNRDPSFPTGDVMRSAWGSRVGDEIILEGAEVNVYTSRLVDIEIAQVGPTEIFGGTLNEIGLIRVDVPDGAEGVQICIELQNDAARLEDFIQTKEYCDSAILNHEFNSSERIRIESDNGPMHAFAQLVNGYNYMRDVVEYEPHKATVAAGVAANYLGGPSDRLFAPCLDFPNLTAAAVDAAIGIMTFGIGTAVVDVLTDIDILLPEDNPHTYNAWTPTHEYGHYALCSMAFNADPVFALSALLPDRIAEGSDIDQNDETAYLNEAFADMFAMQVVGAVNYFNPPSTFASEGMAFCVEPSTFTVDRFCLDRNYSGNTGLEPDTELSLGEGKTRLAARAALFHDALDGNLNAYESDIPGHGHIWSLDSSNLLRLDNWGPGNIREDDPLAMPGTLIDDWFHRWQERGNSLTDNNFLGGLNDALLQQNANWCDRCKLFALHSDQIARTVRTSVSSVPYFPAFYSACRVLPISAYLDEDPPTDKPEQLTSKCEVCADNELAVGDRCETRLLIPPPCPPDQHIVDGFCEPCPSVVIDESTGETDTMVGYGEECIACVGDTGLYDPVTDVCVEECPPGRVPHNGRVCGDVVK